MEHTSHVFTIKEGKLVCEYELCRYAPSVIIDNNIRIDGEIEEHEWTLSTSAMNFLIRDYIERNKPKEVKTVFCSHEEDHVIGHEYISETDMYQFGCLKAGCAMDILDILQSCRWSMDYRTQDLVLKNMLQYQDNEAPMQAIITLISTVSNNVLHQVERVAININNLNETVEQINTNMVQAFRR